MRIHEEPFEFAGNMKIKKGVTHPQIANFGGRDIIIEDWWDRVQNKSWKDCEGNPTALIYSMRIVGKDIPWDDEVVYGKVNGMGHLMHITELEF